VTGTPAAEAPKPTEPRTDRPARPPVVLALVGATGAGKTGVSLAVAPGLRAEIVSVDSMQIYTGMDVGTAKPTRDERRRVPHHMIDIADPGTRFSVAAFQGSARAAADAIIVRGRTPLLVGGSGLYYRAVVDELEFPPTDAAVRSAIARGDPADLVARLRADDPDAAERIDPANVRRVVRALEVMELTSKRFSDFRTAWDRYESRYDLIAAGMRVPSDELDVRVALRVDRMLDAGLVEEVRGLLDRGFRSSLTAARAIAYPEIVAHLDGTISIEEAREQIVRNTRRYARRQMSWFRSDPRIRWFEAADTERATEEIRAYYEHEIARRMVGA
jgi:tRNA dimethylallyltransferase